MPPLDFIQKLNLGGKDFIQKKLLHRCNVRIKSGTSTQCFVFENTQLNVGLANFDEKNTTDFFPIEQISSYAFFLNMQFDHVAYLLTVKSVRHKDAGTLTSKESFTFKLQPLCT